MSDILIYTLFVIYSKSRNPIWRGGGGWLPKYMQYLVTDRENGYLFTFSIKLEVMSNS